MTGQITPTDKPNNLVPVEMMAWSIALCQVFDGRPTELNTVAALLCTIQRLDDALTDAIGSGAH